MSLEKEIEAVVSRVVDEKLRALGIVVQSSEYSSGRLPPGVNARTFARWCRTRVEGAQPDAKGWRCSVDAWRTARAAGRRKAPVFPLVPGSDEDEAAAMVAAARRSA